MLACKGTLEIADLEVRNVSENKCLHIKKFCKWLCERVSTRPKKKVSMQNDAQPTLECAALQS